jgi:polyhydroxybutyrate depolymerase
MTTMKAHGFALVLLATFVVASFGLAQGRQTGRAADPLLLERQWTIDGVVRKALIYVPTTASTAATPLIFVFHGHGGNMRNAAVKFGYHKLWPEALVVYMQGLPTPGMTDPEGKAPGWQKTVGDQKDRDLKFFDEFLASLKKDYKVDEKRIYSTGHSNGGGFTYLLWAARGDVFAAVAPSAGGAARNFKDLKPLPAMHVAGAKDQLVPFMNQKRTMDAVRKLNGCEPEGKPWAKAGALVGTLYPSQTATPFVSVIHPGTHTFPDEAPELIIKFFKENAKK